MIPLVVVQAFDDVQLPSSCRLLMWHLAKRLDTVHYREVKLASLAHEARMGEPKVSAAITRLLADGYLDARPLERRSRAYRLPSSRRVEREVAA